MRKEDIKEDRFQELVTSVIRAYYRSPRNFYIGGAVVVAAIVAIVVLVSNKPKPDPQPRVLLDEAVLILEDQQRPDTNTAEQVLTELTRRYPADPMGLRANFYLGNINYNRGKFEDARRFFEKFAAGEKRDPLLSAAALMGVGNCYEELGNVGKAAEAYSAAYYRHPKWPLADQAVLAAGRTLRQANRLRQAEAIYRAYIKANPKAPSDIVNDVKMQLAYVQTLAANRSGSPGATKPAPGSGQP
ncbi:MAG: tetratricopeptide repeat protein [candidate division WOR-3 bacterium]